MFFVEKIVGGSE